MNRLNAGVGIFVVLLLLLIVAAGVLIWQMSLSTQVPPEIQMGVLAVVAIGALLAVLFVLAAGFSSMGLTDKTQALGLPEGSIRAMIALSLVMVFIIFGIYLFRMVGHGEAVYLGIMDTAPTEKMFGDKKVISIITKPIDKKYDVWVMFDINDDGKKLAAQLITIVGTLVVAVSSFYFGSAVASSAAKKEREGIAAAQAASTAPKPEIKDINPKEGARGNQLPLVIVGTGFTSPKAVRLVRGSDAMAGTEIFSNNTTVRCKVMIDKEPGGDRWDVIVENEDGTLTQVPKVFNIT